jgi:hypothetical protein
MKKFHHSERFVRALFGPIGSGKSVACVNELMIKALQQEPYNGVRSTRWAIVRNTYRELLDTTMETFFQWVPKELGTYSVLNSKFVLELILEDGTKLHAEFLFRALDKPADIKKLLSLEVTGIWMNEARELSKAVIDMGAGRCGRYPAKRDGGPSWFGMIMDTNPPDSDSWFYKLFEEDRPDNHEVFHQPGGLSDEAENVENLPPLYYENMAGGKTKEWLNVYVNGLYGFITSGKPLYPEYRDDLHTTEEEIKVNPELTLYIGIDFGLTPAAAFGQVSPSGQLRLIDELCTFDMGTVSFSGLLNQKLNTHPFNQCTTVEIYGDPAGEGRAQTDEVTPFMILENAGITAWPTHTNDPLIRREVLAVLMMKLDFAGAPAFMIGPKAKMTRKSFAGGYAYKRIQVSGEERFKDTPDKTSKYSHIGDAWQYLALGALGDNSVVGGYGTKEIDYSETNRMVV